MLPQRASPLRHSHTCMSPTYTMSAFEGGFEVLRPVYDDSIWGTFHVYGNSRGGSDVDGGDADDTGVLLILYLVKRSFLAGYDGEGF